MSSDYNNPDFDFPGFNLKRGGNALVSQIQLKGSTSGLLTIKSPAVTGTNSIILPAGTIDFSATGGTSQVLKQTTLGGAITVGQLATSDLSDISTGTWTPSDGSGAGLVFTGSAGYTKIANIILAYADLAFPVTANGNNAVIAGLPFSVANQNYAYSPFIINNNSTIVLEGQVQKNTSTFFIFAGAGNARITNANMSGIQTYFLSVYTTI